jgi:hypothetical protein
LTGKLKSMARSDKARPTQHKPVIESGDITQINTYLESNVKNSPRPYRVWWYKSYNLATHFVSRGLELHTQLSVNSFDFRGDDTGVEYAIINHVTGTAQTNMQGGANDPVGPPQGNKRMYASEGLITAPLKH